MSIQYSNTKPGGPSTFRYSEDRENHPRNDMIHALALGERSLHGDVDYIGETSICSGTETDPTQVVAMTTMKISFQVTL